MRARDSFDYAVIRVVPLVDRDEFVNAGVILFCRTRRFLGSEIALDRERLQALSPAVDLDEVEEQLSLIPLICRGGAAGGPMAELPLSGRFHWLVSPRSTVIQMSSVHSGICEEPESTLIHLVDTMVRLSSSRPRS